MGHESKIINAGSLSDCLAVWVNALKFARRATFPKNSTLELKLPVAREPAAGTVAEISPAATFPLTEFELDLTR
jgi:hypothetical protein